MTQILKRKKKGRPSKADLARRAAEESELRRSRRRRNVRYNFDYDDYLDDDFDEDDEEEERRREKKLKLVVKLNHGREAAAAGGRGGARGMHAIRDEEDEEQEEEVDEEEKEGEEEFERKKVKKRRISASAADEDEDAEEDDDEDIRGVEGRGRRIKSKENDSAPGTPSDHPIVVPLPDKKTLELILDKLQKKDTYGVYAEPVDPEELPYYHEVIEHPMDFSTVRKKLANGSYSTLEDFEYDVFLICSNAMQYNASDTIYHKQARAIEEQATRKFQKLRIAAERSEKESKSEQKPKSNLMAMEQLKKPLGRPMQEHVASDFSPGATLAKAGDVQMGSITNQPNMYDKSCNKDVLVDGRSSLVDNSLEKAEELSSGKGLLLKSVRKNLVLDENRRETYNISIQPIVGSDSIFTTFDGEIKQLIPVGLQAEYSYARSLARFAATLGPVAWRVASRRIEQAVPAGYKFGRGWVGEYEPLPTPVLMLETRPQKESAILTKFQQSMDRRKEKLPQSVDRQKEKLPQPVDRQKERLPQPVDRQKERLPQPVDRQKERLPQPVDRQKERLLQSVDWQKEKLLQPVDWQKEKLRQSVDRQQENLSQSVDRQQENLSHKRSMPVKEHPSSEPAIVGTSSIFHMASGSPPDIKPSFLASGVLKPSNPANAVYQQSSSPRIYAEPENRISKQVELNLPPPVSHNGEFIAKKQNSYKPETASSSRETVTRNLGPGQSAPLKPVETNGVRSGHLPNGKIPNQVNRASNYFPQGQEQGLSDPIQVMRMLNERAQKQQNSSSQSPADTPKAMSSNPFTKRDDSNSAAAAAARAWMSIGAGGFKQATENSSSPKGQILAESLYNPAREFHPQIQRVRGEFPISTGMQMQMQFQSQSRSPKNSFPPQAFAPQPVHLSEAQFQTRPMFFPQMVATDLSRFQMQSPWRGLSPQTQPRQQRQDSLPPDLNIGFQSPGSPARQSSSVLKDSQQPDLALQL